jgi:hypothetical protein
VWLVDFSAIFDDRDERRSQHRVSVAGGSATHSVESTPLGANLVSRAYAILLPFMASTAQGAFDALVASRLADDAGGFRDFCGGCVLRLTA